MIREEVAERYGEELLFMDPRDFDDCILGICEQFGRPPVVAYDLEKVLAKYVASGMPEEDAEDWFYFNTVGAWMGDCTPVFVRRLA